MVGPAERLLLRRVPHSVRFDRHAVTVGRYRRFLEAINPDGASAWDHPDQPANVTHHPWAGRLREPDYYRDGRYDAYPAVCVSLVECVRLRGLRGQAPAHLPEMGGRRPRHGRPSFPWGDEADGARVNCADTWVGHPLVTFQAW